MSAWIEHCKSYAKQNNIPYKQAMKDAKASYKPVEGGKFKMKNVMRKTKNTVKKIHKVAKELEPYVELATSGAGVGMNGGCPHCGSVSGGSFKAIGGSGIQSSLIHSYHPSFDPKPPKSIKKRQVEN